MLASFRIRPGAPGRGRLVPRTLTARGAGPRRRATPGVEVLENRVALSAVDAVLNGFSAPVPGSSGSLRVRLDGTSAQVQWGSTDSFLGITVSSLLTPTQETVTTGPGGVPIRLVFVASENGVTYSGNIALSNRDRGILDVTTAARHTRYQLDQAYSRPCQPLTDAELEVFAKSFAYDETPLSVGEQVVGFNYVVNTFFDDPTTGFQAYGLTCGNMAPPILAVRGTAGLSDLISDANPQGIGFDQFQANIGSVTRWLRAEQQQTGLAPEITGHSLGGALTQWIATSYTAASPQDVLSEVVTFNSPGIDATYAQSFVPGQVLDGVRHYINSGDIVSMAGQAFIAGNWILAKSTFGPLFSVAQLNPLNKHTYPMLADSIEGKSRPAVTLTTFNNVSWLNSPLFLYNTPDYYVLLTATSAVLGAVNPTLAPLPLALVFRSTSEAARVAAGSVIYSAGIPTLVQDIQQIIATAMQTGKIQATLPSVNLGFGGVMLLRAQQMQVTYDTTVPRLEIQGKVTLPLLFNATADLTGSNFIGIRDDGIDLVGTLTVPSIPIVPNIWELQNLQLSLDTTTQTVSASGSMVFGPSLNYSIPLLGDVFSGHVIDAQVSGTITPQGFSSQGSLSLLGGLASIPMAALNIDFTNKTLSGSGQVQFLNGAVTASASFQSDSTFALMASGAAMVTVPDAIPLIGGDTLSGGSFTLAYDPNAPLSDDSFTASGTFLGVTVGFRVSLDGSVSVL